MHVGFLHEKRGYDMHTAIDKMYLCNANNVFGIIIMIKLSYLSHISYKNNVFFLYYL
jgi:hypothetical protein